MHGVVAGRVWLEGRAETMQPSPHHVRCTLALTVLQVQSTTLPSTIEGRYSGLCVERSGCQSDTND